MGKHVLEACWLIAGSYDTISTAGVMALEEMGK
jgi:hypothetical protein